MTGAPPRRILMTTDTVGGVWTYALELARALGGIEITLAAMGEPSPAQLHEADALPNVTLLSRPLRLEWMDEPWDDVARAGAWLLELEARVRPDVVHLNGYAHGALPWRAPAIAVGHSCVLSWHRAVRGTEAPPSWDRYRREVGRGLRAVRRVVAPSAAMLRSLDADYGPLPGARVIWNGRDPRGFARAVPKQPIVFSAGRFWDEGKNLAALEAVAPRLSWPVLVAGDLGHPDGETRRPAHVRALGRQSAVGIAELMSHASIYALPARYEPFGLSPLEAALCGCVLVLGDLPSLREIWGEAAIFVEPTDHDALHAALERLIARPAERAALAAAARARAAELSPETMARGYLELYHSLTEEVVACA